MSSTALPTELFKRIDVSKAKATGLRAAFALPPDESDYERYMCDELCQHIEALDARFGLDINTPDLQQRRFRALFELTFGVPADSGDWNGRAFLALLLKTGVSFYIEKRGRPPKWSYDLSRLLVEDHQRLKRKYPDLKGDNFWIKLRSCRPTWAAHSIPALRKAYAEAKKTVPILPPAPSKSLTDAV